MSPLLRVYWRDSHSKEPYYTKNYTYEDCGPAYRLGYSHRAKDGNWEGAEGTLKSEWERTKGASRLGWEEAKHAARAGWTRVTHPTTTRM